MRTLGEILVVWRRLDVPRTPLATVYAEAELLNEDFGYGSDAMSCSVPVTVKEGSYLKVFCFVFGLRTQHPAIEIFEIQPVHSLD